MPRLNYNEPGHEAISSTLMEYGIGSTLHNYVGMARGKNGGPI